MCIRDSHVHGRHPVEHVHLPPQHQVQGGVRLEAAHQDQGGAQPERGVHRHGLAVGVEQRQAAEHHVVRAGLVAVERVHRGVEHQVELAEHGALGLAGGAAGVEDHRRVLGLPAHVGGQGRRARRAVLQPGQPVGLGRAHGHHGQPGQCRGPGARLGQHAVAHQQARAAVPQHVRHLLGGEQQVHRHHHGAGRQDRVVGGRERHRVGRDQRDPVARCHAQLAQAGGQGQGPCPQLRVAHLGGVVGHGEPFGVAAGRLRQHTGQGQGHRHSSGVDERTRRGWPTGSGVARRSASPTHARCHPTELINDSTGAGWRPAGGGNWGRLPNAAGCWLCRHTDRPAPAAGRGRIDTAARARPHRPRRRPVDPAPRRCPCRPERQPCRPSPRPTA